MDDHVLRVAKAYGIDIAPIEKSHAFCEIEQASFREALVSKFDPSKHEQIDVVLTGSFARGDLTAGSDCDYLVVVHETTDPRKTAQFLNETRRIAEGRGFKPPGTQGLFGDLVTANELVARIGLEGDTNTSHTRRILLLTESVSVYQPSLRDLITKTILERYCADYDPAWRTQPNERVDVPRFVLRDLVRYWRTMAVDFGAKQWKDLSPSFLRHSKLLITRKILFAGSLAALFRAGTRLDPHDGESLPILLERLTDDFRRPPIGRLMALFNFVDEPAKDGLASILKAYCRFIEMLSVEETRRSLAASGGDEDSEIFQEVRNLASDVKSGLEAVFFGEERILPLTRTYGVF